MKIPLTSHATAALIAALHFCASIPATAADTEDVVTEVKIGTLPGLRYDHKQFDVKPASKVKITFRNTDTMQHNLLIVQPSTRAKVVQAAADLGAAGPQKNYIPESENVLWSIGVVDQGATATLEFTAPATPADYPFVCTFPGHGQIMFGTMRVTHDPQPPVRNSPTLPTNPSTPPIDDQRAFVKRTFMPDATPAAIAVHLPGGHSYCWDAGACRFRYAWQGGFLTPGFPQTDQPVGEIYFRETVGFPIYLGNETPRTPSTISFLGYTLDKRGIPEFQFQADHLTISERVDLHEGHLKRRFRISGGEDPLTLWFKIDSAYADQIRWTGERQGQFIKLTGGAAREFFITVIPPQNTPENAHQHKHHLQK